MIKNIVKKIIYKNRCDSQTYINYLRSLGIIIGDETKIYSPRNVIIDEQNPWLIEIGNNVQITDGVRILTHGYDWSVLKVKYGEVYGSAGKVKIGNNVFIGMNSTILKGTSIGDNVIIGANSLVNKDCLKEGVYAGNPAKYIMSLEDYREKRGKAQLKEAVNNVIEYKKRFGKYPPKEKLREFFFIFEDRNIELCNVFDDVIKLEGNYEKTLVCYKNSKPLFKNYDEFLSYVSKEERNDNKDNKKNSTKWV